VTIPLRAYGQYAVRVHGAREFVVQVVGSVGQVSAQATARALLDSPIVTCIQQVFGDYLAHQRVSALELPAHTLALVDRVTALLAQRYRSFGIELLNFTIESINFDAKDESVLRLRSMLDEAARLDVVGDAYRRNQDLYRAERQFDVMEAAAQSGGAAGAVMGAAMGVGLGFGVGQPAGDLARKSMVPLPAEAKACPDCGTGNAAPAKFCQGCGKALGPRKCAKCGVDLPPAAKFCSECGQSA
jgi:membrane protease subunit (stomatin/prohibitin family)